MKNVEFSNENVTWILSHFNTFAPFLHNLISSSVEKSGIKTDRKWKFSHGKEKFFALHKIYRPKFLANPSRRRAVEWNHYNWNFCEYKKEFCIDLQYIFKWICIHVSFPLPSYLSFCMKYYRICVDVFKVEFYVLPFGEIVCAINIEEKL